MRRAVAAAAGRRWRFAGHPPAWPAARASACAPDLGRGVGNSFRSAPAKKSAIPRRGALCHFPIRRVPVTNENACRRKTVTSGPISKPRGSRFRLEESDTHARARRQASSGSTMAATAPERELLKRFEVQKFLGKGSYGSVYVRASRLGAHLASSIFLDPCWLFMTRVTSRAKTARRDGRRVRALGDEGCAARAATFTASDAPIAFPAATGHRACRVSGRVSVPGRREPPPGEQPPSCLVTRIRAFFFFSGRDRRSTREARTARSAGGVCSVLRPATDRRPAPIATRTTFVPTATASAA